MRFGTTILSMRSLGLTMVFLLTGCGAFGGRDVDMTPVAAQWTADVRAIGESGHSGFATGAITTTGRTRMNVTLSGGSAGGVHPWHVHVGGCDANGEIVGSADTYPVLRPDERGNASATATLELALEPDEEYSVHIHDRPDDVDTIVGCGDLVLRD